MKKIFFLFFSALIVLFLIQGVSKGENPFIQKAYAYAVACRASCDKGYTWTECVDGHVVGYSCYAPHTDNYCDGNIVKCPGQMCENIFNQGTACGGGGGGGSCNVNNCPYFCDGRCNLYNPTCSGNSCAQGSLIQSNSSTCNGIRWNGVPEVCPIVTQTWTNYCTGGNDANGNYWQIWAYDNSNPINYKYVGPGTVANGCVPNCNTGGSCGSCSVSCGGGTQSCTYTTSSSWGICTPQSYSQSCNTQPCSWNLTVNAYIDYNGNGFQNPEDTSYNGTINYSGGINGSHSLAPSGSYTISTIPPGNETVSLVQPSGWTATTTNPVTKTGPPNQTVNFGTQPPPPVCGPTGPTGSLTANPTTVYLGGSSKGTSNLGVTCTAGGGGSGTLNYSWTVVADPRNDHTPANIGSIVNTNSNSTTYTSPAIGSTFYPFDVDVAVTACNPGTNPNTPATCTSKTVVITVLPYYSISGFVFVDANKDAVKNSGESNYTSSPALTISVCPGQFCSSGGAPITATNGVFDTGYALPAGQYSVSASGLSTGYSFTTPPTLAPTTGNPCSPSNGVCDLNNNVYNLHFGISNSNTWIQTTGGDVYMAGGISNTEPGSSECGGPHMSINQNPTIQMPGIMLTGNRSADFGAGDASLNNWVVGKGNIYPNSITLPSATSYAAVKKSVQDNGFTITDLPCASGNYATGCVLSNNLSSGVYSVNGDLKLTGAGNTYTFPSTGDFTFLITGKLDIETEIHVPIGSTATFIAQGDITVGKDIGAAAYNSSAATLEGYYSTDGSFIIYGSDPTKASSCPTADKRLNIAGAVVTDANNDSNGSFQVKRDMCENDICPTFSIQARPDFVLNAPLYLQTTTRIWKEIAP